jgi:tetratricopeptide (TPR) repeat protein
LDVSSAGGTDGAEADPQAQTAALKREALDEAEAVLRAYPDEALSYALLGSAYFNIGRSEEAANHLRQCLELDPEQVDACEILARIAYEKGLLEETVRLCEEGLKHNPRYGELLNRLGRTLLDLGQTEDAIGVLQQALQLPKRVVETHYLLGQAYMQTGDPVRAKGSFQQVIAVVPDHTQAFFGLFTASTRLGEAEQAARYREQFLRLEAADRRTLVDRSAQDDRRAGLPLVRETVARTLMGAGQIYQVHGQPEKATRMLLRAAELDPGNAMSRMALEALYAQRHAMNEAVAAFTRLAEEQPDNSLNHLFLGRLHGRLQQFEEAERSYLKVQQLDPELAEGYRALAELYVRQNLRPIQAKALAQRALDLAPGAASYYLLAVTCMKTDDRTGALAAMGQAVALSPENKSYREFLKHLRQTP